MSAGNRARRGAAREGGRTRYGVYPGRRKAGWEYRRTPETMSGVALLHAERAAISDAGNHIFPADAPQSTNRTWPVMDLACGDARNMTASAKSSGSGK